MKVPVALLILVLAPLAGAQEPPAPAATPAGIPLDAAWKRAVYTFATQNLKHSAWGVSHSERDYLLASRLAAEEKLALDADVLFAAAFLHDVGAFEAWRKDGVDHCDRAAEVVPGLLADAGFPSAKVEAVQEAVRNHMYYRADARRPEAVALHDADTLDFLGAIGVARIVSLTGRHRWATDLQAAVKTLGGFHEELPAKLVTAAAKRRSAERVAEGKAFLAALRAEAEGGKAF